MLIRAMVVDGDKLPVVRPHKNYLGLVTSGSHPDVVPDESGEVSPGDGGLSGVTTHPNDLPAFRRPRQFGGSSPGVAFVIDDASKLTTRLTIRPDTPPHAMIEPASRMSVSDFEQEIANTRTLWRIWP